LIEETVKKYCRQQGLTLKELAGRIGMTETGLSRSLKKRSLKVKTLEDIAEVLEVPIGFFFGEGERLEEKLEDYPAWKEGVEERLRALEKEVRRMRGSD
jgi:transcriptional regulator with XRE-family HTH domain